MSVILKTEKVIKEWTDYNSHLNVAYYVRIFDIAADVMLDNFKMGGDSAKKDKKTNRKRLRKAALESQVQLQMDKA